MTQRPGKSVAGAISLVLALAAPAEPARAEASPVPAGVWLMQNGKAAVEFFACEGGLLCGRLMWGRPDQFPDGGTRDRRNPDPAKRDRELCGATVIWGLEDRGDGDWGGGGVYDPTSGETYGAKMSVRGPQELRVRGYILGIPLFGKSQTWRPAPPDILEKLCMAPRP